MKTKKVDYLENDFETTDRDIPEVKAVSFFDALEDIKTEQVIEEDKSREVTSTAVDNIDQLTSIYTDKVKEDNEDNENDDSSLMEDSEAGEDEYAFDESFLVNSDIAETPPTDWATIKSLLTKEFRKQLITLGILVVALLSIAIPYFSYICGRNRGKGLNFIFIVLIIGLGAAVYMYGVKVAVKIKKFLRERNYLG